MKVKGKFKTASMDVVNNKSVVEFEVEGCNLTALSQELQQMGELSIDIKRHRNKRSLDANAYFWVLVDKLSEVTGYKKTEIYRNAIKDIGGVSDVVCIQDKAVSHLCEAWCKGSLGRQVDITSSKVEGCQNVILYYGSSEYDTKQMSMLIDSIVQDCKAVGVETMTPDELAKLKAAWKGK
jgi:hypothetical protein